MKKVIITTCAVVFAAVAASAQGLGTVRDINGFGAEYLARQSKSARQQTIKKEQKQVGSLQKAIEQANVRHNRQMFVMGALGDAAQFVRYTQTKPAEKTEKKAAPAAKPESAEQKGSSFSSYHPYMGREGKIMAMGDVFAERIKARKAARKQAKEAAPAAKKEEKKGSWLGALFGGRYPGESDEDYKHRLAMSSYPACQPFK